jgi:excisionase family DNA binding protein
MSQVTTKSQPVTLPRILSATEVAALLGVSMTTVYQWARSGELPAIRLGRRFGFPLPDLEARLRGTTTAKKTWLRSFAQSARRQAKQPQK